MHLLTAVTEAITTRVTPLGATVQLVHDSLIIDCPDEHREEVLKIVDEEMERILKNETKNS